MSQEDEFTADRAPSWHSGGRRFDPVQLHLLRPVRERVLARVWQGLLLLMLASCQPIEDTPETLYKQLRGCASRLVEAEAIACGEAVLDEFDMGWKCSCEGDETPWEFCGTRADVEDLVKADPRVCSCDRVGRCP